MHAEEPRDTVLTAPATEAPLDFDAVYEAHVDFVRFNASRLGVREATADDVVQKVFVIVHRRLAEFEHRSTIKTWLLGILLRVVREERRSLRRRFSHWLRSEVDPDELASEQGPTPLELVARAEAHRLVHALLDTLEPAKREVFVLAELEELTASQISEITGLEPAAVYTKLRAARIDFERAVGRFRRAERLGTR
jgi:RNA polymerase sigma-70 factor (ECF subfamily)